MRDVIGNELKVGDLVAIQLDRPLIFGQVVEINEGQVVLAGQGAQPGRAVVMCKQVVAFDPRSVCGAVLALRDDANRAKIGSEERTDPIQALPN
jgi:hypothetical protein